MTETWYCIKGGLKRLWHYRSLKRYAKDRVGRKQIGDGEV
jgi:hypothetical protein